MRSGRFLGALAAVLAVAVVSARVTGQPSRPAGPVGEARRQIDGLLAESAASGAKGDLVSALNLAGRALTVAAKELPPGDEAYVRTALTSTRLRCEYFLARRNPKGALNSANDGVRFAQRHGKGELALGWARYGAAVAARELPEGDPDRARADVVLAVLECQAFRMAGEHRAALEKVRGAGKVAATLPAGDPDRVQRELLDIQLRSEQAVRDGDLVTASALAGEAVSLGKTHLTEGNPDRVRAQVDLALIEFRKKDDAAALATAAGAAREAERNPRDNVLNGIAARLVTVVVKVSRGGADDAGLAPEFAGVAKSLPPEGRPVFYQDLLRVFVWSPLLDAAKDAAARRGAGEEAEARLGRAIDAVLAGLRGAGLDAPEAMLGRLGLAQLQWEGRRIAAADATLRALDPHVERVKDATSLVAPYWNLRGLIETERANYDRARVCFEKALDLVRVAGSPDRAEALSGLGQLLLRQGDYEAASKPLREAVTLYHRRTDAKESIALTVTLLNLALATEGTGGAGESEALRRRALALAEAGPRPDPYAVLLCRSSLGHGHFKRGRFVEARGEFERARSVASGAFGPDHFHTAEADVNLGWVALVEGRLAEAQALFRAASGVFRAALGDDHPRTPESQTYLALSIALAGDGPSPEARGLLESALASRERYLGRVLRSALSERDRLALVQELRVHPESSAWPGALDMYLQLSPRLGIPAVEQYRHVLAWKGVLNRHTPPPASDLEPDPVVRATAARREDALRRLRDAVLHDPKGEQVARLEAEVDSLERTLRTLSGRFRRGGAADDLTPGALAKALPAGSALLDVIKVRRHEPRKAGEPVDDRLAYVAVLVRSGREPLRIDLGDAVPIDLDVTAFRAALQAGRDVGGPGGRLSPLIRGRVAPHAGGLKTLVIAADGLLHRLPFAALPGVRPGTFWVDEVAFASVQSAQSLLERRAIDVPAGTGALVVGGVDYGKPAAPGPGVVASRGLLSTGWVALEGTLREANEVVEIFRKSYPGEDPVELLTGAEARKATLRDGLPKRRVVHLGTHGYFDMKNDPVKGFSTLGASAVFGSCVVLAGANSGEPDGLLTADEVGQLDLRGVDLITLSACQSGLGRIREGQGVVGLLNSLDRAGAPAVVCSLWNVNDEATRVFMKSFYGHLWTDRGPTGPAAALRAAQRDMITGDVTSKDGDSFAHPAHWASFFLSGYPEPPARPRPPTARR